MKKNLLSPESKSYHSLQQKPLRFFFALVLVSVFGITTKTHAQCPTFYQAFESFGGVISGSTGGAGLVQGVTGTNYWTISGYTPAGAGANTNSGSTAAIFSTAAAASYIITPKIATLKDFSFWYRRNGLSSNTTIAVEYSTNYTGVIGNVPTATWTNIANVISPTSATYTQYSSPLNLTNVYIRVRWSAGVGMILDDLGWTSNTASENTSIVLTKGTGTCTTTPALLSNVAYSFYDNGGATDSYNLSQDQTVTFTPANSERIKLQFITNTSGTATETYTISSPTFPNLLPAWISTSATTIPSASPYYSEYCETATFRYQTAATGSLTAGFKLTVTSDPAAACSGAVSSPTVTPTTITYNSAAITWGALSGCTAPAGYDYYISNAAGTPPSGALTASNTTALQAGYVFNSGATATGTPITGLAGSTLYYGWVRRNCSGTYGAWTPITNTGGIFSTLCTPIAVTTPFPSVENFTGVSTAQINTSATCLATNSGSSGIATSSGNNYFFNTSNGTWFFSKPLTLDPTKIYRVSFDYGNSAGAATTVEAYYGKTNFSVLANNPGSLLATANFSNTIFATNKSYFQPSTASTYYIGIKVTSIAGGAFIMDNLKIEVVPCWPGTKPTFITGPTNSCPGLSVSYTATPGTAFAGTTTTDGVANASSTATGFTWTVPVGWVVTANGAATATVTTGIIPGNVSATGDLTSCDSSLPLDYAVSSSAIPAQPSTISGPTSFCTLPNNGLVYTVTNSAASYVWSFPTGWTVVSGANTNSVTVNATGAAVSGTVTATPYGGAAATGCSGTPRTLAVSVGTITNSTFGTAATIAPASPTATDSFRCGNRHFWYAYTVPGACGGTFKINLAGNGGDIDLYVFPSSPSIANVIPQPTTGIITGGSGLSASATEAVTVNLTAGSTYYILVYAFTAVVDGGGTFNLSVSSQSIGTPGPISGTGSVSCSSVTNTTYSVPVVPGATGYNWTLPAGWAITAGTNTNSINIVTTGSTAGTISVIATGPCGISIPATKIITVGQIQPDAISGPPQLCSPFTATTYSISPVIGATSYIWTLPVGWTGTSTSTSITATPSSTSGNIGVSAVGPCGTSPVTTYAVVTASSVTSSNALICAGSSGSMTSTTNPVTTFTMSDVPTTAPSTFVRSFGTPTPPYSSSGTTVAYTTTTITTLATGAGTYVFNGCASGDTFLHIYDTTFNPASPATNFLAANDDGNTACTLDPRITIDLLASHTYVLVYSTYTSITSGITGITMDITPPTGVAGILFGTTDWYTVASGGTPIFSGPSFNPEGVVGSGVPTPTVPNIYTFYATNSLSSYCRTATTFTVSAAPTQSITPTAATVLCPSAVYPVAVNASGTGVTTTWTSNVANTLFSNVTGTTTYAPLTNAAVVYVKSTVAVTVTATSTVGTCSVSSSVTYTIAPYKIWDDFVGDWSPGPGVPPTINNAIIINNGWTNGDLQGCSCTVNSGTVEFFAGDTLTLTNQLTVSGGTVIFNDESSLYQTAATTNATAVYSGGNTGSIKYSRTAQPMFKFDYTYWSSPVSSQNLFAVATGAPVPFFYRYNYTTQAWQYVNPSFTTMEVGRGYIWRAPVGFPISPATPQNFTANFIGVPNNGTLTYPIATGAAQLNLIGNPYPSALSANDFINATANNNITGTLFFWTHNTYITAAGQYANADYASYNLSGGVATGATTGIGTGPGSGPGNTGNPIGIIASGQGFFVKGITGTPSGSPGPYSVTFTNSMRRGGVNDRTNFFKNNQAVANTAEIQKDRFWINISNSDGGFKQALIGYIENATNELDRMYDGDFVDVGNPVAIYSVIDNTSLTIQGRQLPFTSEDLVYLGYKSLTTGNCTISMDHFDAFFDNQAIYIEDKLLGIVHNLKVSPYIFATEVGTFDDRFVIRYTTDTLGSNDPVFNENSVKVFKDEMGLHIITGNVLMKSAKLFDITGRLITSRDNISASEALFTTLPKTQQIVLVQITSETGGTVTKKVLF